jgi:hypothetical protein
MNADQGRPCGRDPDTRRGIGKALGRALGAPLLVDAAADAAFASSIARLRGETNAGGKP